MRSQYDLVIIGGGCSGLSLGYQLAILEGNIPKTLLIEPRLKYTNDRTWCFWEDTHNPFSTLCMHHWKELLVVSEDRETVLICTGRPYQLLAGDIFYEYTQHKIASNPRIELRLGIRLIKEVEYKNGLWLLTTNQGIIASKLVVDTRPSLTSVAYAIGEPMENSTINALEIATLWQSFLGYEVECEVPLFDPHRATLMDFCDPNSEYVGFTYVLPITKHIALIEFTTFGALPYSAQELLTHLEEKIQNITQGQTYQIKRTESGSIPMGMNQDALSRSKFNSTNTLTYVYAGVSAGAARSATGYAFQRIQKWAIECAFTILNNAHPTPQLEDSFIVRKMDSLFLNVIKNNPKLGPSLFVALFSNVKTDRLIRFLTDQGSMMDYAAVVLALPKRLFLKGLYKLVLHR